MKSYFLSPFLKSEVFVLPSVHCIVSWDKNKHDSNYTEGIFRLSWKLAH